MALELSLEERRYLIFPFSQVNLINFDEVLETSIETMRLSVDNTKTFIKWDGATPSCVSSLTNTSGPYTHPEMLQILATSEWTPNQT